MAYLWIYFSRSYRNAAPAAPTAPKNNVLEGFYIIYIFLSFALLAAGIGYHYNIFITSLAPDSVEAHTLHGLSDGLRCVLRTTEAFGVEHIEQIASSVGLGIVGI